MKFSQQKNKSKEHRQKSVLFILGILYNIPTETTETIRIIYRPQKNRIIYKAEKMVYYTEMEGEYIIQKWQVQNDRKVTEKLFVYNQQKVADK